MDKLKFLVSYQTMPTIIREVTALTNNKRQLICPFSHNNIIKNNRYLLRIKCTRTSKSKINKAITSTSSSNSINSIFKTCSLQRTQVLNSKSACSKTFKRIKCSQDKSNQQHTMVFNKQISISNKTLNYNINLIKTFKSLIMNSNNSIQMAIAII